MLMKMMMDEQVHQEMMTRKLQPRLCYLTKGNRGYGFHLHGERRHGAQYIRRIEAGSPAELAGLRSGDRVVEVNGENVEKDSHQQVVQKIMAVESRTRLLVVDQETDDFLRHHFLPCTEDQAVESSCFLSGRRSRPASASPSSCNSLTLSLRSSTVSSRRHSGGSQNFSLRGSDALGSCDSHLSSASRSAPPSPQESNNLGSCDSAPPSARESDLLRSSDSAPLATNTLGSCDSTVPSHQEYVTLGSCVSAPPSAQEYDTLGSSDSTPPSPMESTRLSSCDPTPSSSRNSDHPLILESSCDSAPSSPQDSNLASQTLRSFPLSSYDLNPPRSTPSPTYDVITLPSGRNEFYKTQTMQGAPIATHGNQETLGSQDATVTPDQRPRLCQVALGRQGFGFNLHCDRCREGQYIRSVDPDSPAERAGLVPGDRLIQVNEQRIEGLKHSEVVALIRGCGQETRLLVVDPETDALFRKLGITPTTTHLKEDCVDGPMTETRPPVSNGGPKPQTHGCSSSSSMLSGNSADPGSLDTDTKIFHAAATSTESPEPRQRKELWDDDLHLSPTAAEARQKVRSGKAKKAAPPMSWSKKYEVFSNF